MPNSVLIVDDEEIFLRRFAEEYGQWFLRLGMEVETKLSDAAARRYLRKAGPSVQLMIVDILLPKLENSVRLLSFAKSRFPSIGRIGMTSKVVRKTVDGWEAASLIHGFIDKRWKEAKIKKEIKRVLDEPPEAAAHSKITEAFRAWLEQHPKARDIRMHFLGAEPMTLGKVLEEIEKGTRFGKQQEKMIFQLACNLFTKQKKNRTTKGL